MAERFVTDASTLPTGTRVAGFEGAEGLSTPFQYVLWLLIPEAQAADLDPATVLLTDGSLVLMTDDGSPRRTVRGVWSSLELLDEMTGGDSLYRAELVPTAWKLSLSRHSRVWVDKTVPEILEEVLTLGGLPASRFSLRLTGRYKQRPHTCQYRESDWDFASRLMEREGIYYGFEHTDAGDTLVVWDNVSSQPTGDDAHIGYLAETTEGDSGREGFRRFTARAQYSVKDVVVRDHDPLKPTTRIEGRADGNARLVPTEVRHMEEVSVDSGAARRAAGLRAEESLAAAAQRFYGEGVVFGVAPGHRFALESHPRASLNQGYQCVAVKARGRLFSGAEMLQRWVSWYDQRTHWTEVTAMKDGVQFRPDRVTPKPAVTGHEIAFIDGPATSEYAQLDEHGRYRVRFHFDERASADGLRSTWVRMLQPHAGNPEGMHFPLRKGTEVTVLFLAGDPDRPIIAGAVPDNEHPAPVTSANHTHNVVQTGGNNRLEIEDLAGSQYVDLSTPTQNTQLHLGTIHGSHSHNYVSTTDGNGLLHTGSNLDVTVGGNKHEHVTLTLNETYHSTLTSEVTGTVTEDHKTTMTTTVTGHVQEESLSHTTVVKGHTIEECASQQTTVTGHLEETHGQQHTLIDGRLYVRSGTHDETSGTTSARYGTLLIQVTGAFTLTSAGPISITALNWQDNAPVQYKVVTNTRKHVVGGSWFNLRPLFFEAIGFKQATTQLTVTVNIGKIDIGKTAKTANGFKLDITGNKCEVSGVRLKRKVAEVRNEAGELIVSPFSMFN